MADTLAAMLARAANKAAVRRFNDNEAKLAETIAAGIQEDIDTALESVVSKDLPNLTTVEDADSTDVIPSLIMEAPAVIFTNASAPEIHGIHGGGTQDGDLRILINGSSSNLTIKHNGGAAENPDKITAPGLLLDAALGTTVVSDAVLLPGQSIALIRANSRWRALSPVARLVPAG